MKEVRNIQKAILNGRQVKLFEVWQLRDNAWHFYGKYAVSLKVPNKKLLNYVEEREV